MENQKANICLNGHGHNATLDIRESYLPPDRKIEIWAASVRPKYVKQYGELAEEKLSIDAWAKYED